MLPQRPAGEPNDPAGDGCSCGVCSPVNFVVNDLPPVLEPAGRVCCPQLMPSGFQTHGLPGSLLTGRPEAAPLLHLTSSPLSSIRRVQKRKRNACKIASTTAGLHVSHPLSTSLLQLPAFFTSLSSPATLQPLRPRPRRSAPVCRRAVPDRRQQGCCGKRRRRRQEGHRQEES
jgi:hypothetical protein